MLTPNADIVSKQHRRDLNKDYLKSNNITFQKTETQLNLQKLFFFFLTLLDLLIFLDAPQKPYLGSLLTKIRHCPDL